MWHLHLHGDVWEVGRPCGITALVGRSRAVVCSRREEATQEPGRGSRQNLTHQHPNRGLSASGAGGATCPLSPTCGAVLWWPELVENAHLHLAPATGSLNRAKVPCHAWIRNHCEHRAADSPAVLSAQLCVPAPRPGFLTLLSPVRPLALPVKGQICGAPRTADPRPHAAPTAPVPPWFHTSLAG